MVKHIYGRDMRFKISYLKVTSSLTRIVNATHGTLYRCEMLLPCARAARAPTSTNSSRSRQECRRPFPPAPLNPSLLCITWIIPVSAICPSRNRGESTASERPTLSFMNPRFICENGLVNDRAVALFKLTSRFCLIRRLSDGRLHHACDYVLG